MNICERAGVWMQSRRHRGGRCGKGSVVDLHDESLVWLLPYQEVQQAGIKFSE